MTTELAPQTLSLEKYNELKGELVSLAKAYTSLTIDGVDDKEGYAAIKTARKALQVKRTYVENTGKELRAGARSFSDQVIQLEKELVAIIKPTEEELKAKTDEIDEAIRQAKRKKAVPTWQAVFAAVNVLVDETHILESTDEELNEELYLIKQEQAEALALKLAEQEAKLESERKAFEEEKLAIQREKDKQAAIEQARKDEQEKAAKAYEAKLLQDKLDAEAKIKEAEDRAKAAEAKAAKEKADAKAKAEKEKADAAAKAKKDKEDAEAKIKAEEEAAEAERQLKIKTQKALEATQAYQEYLNSIGYVPDDNHKIFKTNDNRLIIYRKIGEYNIQGE